MTQLQLWNAALGKLPHDRTVASLDENSTEAIRCRMEWDSARTAVLTAHPWGFLKRDSGLMHGMRTCAHGQHMYAYQYPAEHMKLLGLFSADGRKLKADVVNGMILSTSPVASIRYLNDETDPSKMPPLVVDAIVLNLAQRLAPIVTGQPRLQADLMARATVALSNAKQADSMEVEYSGTTGTTYIDARR